MRTDWNACFTEGVISMGVSEAVKQVGVTCCCIASITGLILSSSMTVFGLWNQVGKEGERDVLKTHEEVYVARRIATLLEYIAVRNKLNMAK